MAGALAKRAPRVERVMGARLRILALLLVAALLAGAVWARLAYWQVLRHVQLSAQAQAQYHEVVELPAVRGAIFDRNLTQLVVNTTVYSAFVSPDQVAQGVRERVADGLSSVLGVDKAGVRQTLESGSKFAYVLRRFPKAKADQLLADGVHKANAESGSVLIMDPTTGGIVAWADYPSYDANNFTHTDTALFKDNISSYLYEPGSVMKVVTLAGAINQGAITPSTVINDPGYLNVGGYRIADWDHRNHGNNDYTYVLAHSLNVGAMKAMLAEGHTADYSYLKGFGLTQASGIDVAGENYVPLPAQDQMSDSQFATTAFGQGIGVNMIQMLSAVNVIANQGRYAPPHVVERVGTSINPLLLKPQRQVITAQAAQEMTAMMENVVQHGSGWTSRVKGFELDQAGKTGTSQIPVNGQYTLDVWASYVGYLTAAPVWQKIAQAIVVDWRVTPD